ncbi:MAG: type II toxin-antitoxin system VapC family toxin [Thiobacillus sp.]
MKLLLDTHALLWWWTDDSRLSNAARQAIADEGNQILVSAASAWEIATKFRLGKLPHGAQARERFNELVEADGFEHLPISFLHSLKAGAYSNEHRDPFDRMLAAQAELEKAVLVTLDPVFAGFQCKLLW